MITLKASTANGKRVLAIYNSLKGTEIYDVYTNISKSFRNTYEKLHSEYCNDVLYNNASDWHVTFHAGSWSWSCGYKAIYNNQVCIIVHTRENHYCVLLNQ